MTDTVGRRIRQERENRSWDQGELSARAFGNTGRTSDISHWENDKREPSLRNLRALARAFSLRIYDLIPDSDHTEATE